MRRPHRARSSRHGRRRCAVTEPACLLPAGSMTLVDDEHEASRALTSTATRTSATAILPPEALAERLAAAGVVGAALTDHDTVDGLAAFPARSRGAGIGFIPGVETHHAVRQAARRTCWPTASTRPTPSCRRRCAPCASARQGGVQSIAVVAAPPRAPARHRSPGGRSAQRRAGRAHRHRRRHRAGPPRRRQGLPGASARPVSPTSPGLARSRAGPEGPGAGRHRGASTAPIAAEHARAAVRDWPARLGLLVSAGTDAHGTGGAARSAGRHRDARRGLEAFRDALRGRRGRRRSGRQPTAGRSGTRPTACKLAQFRLPHHLPDPAGHRASSRPPSSASSCPPSSGRCWTASAR